MSLYTASKVQVVPLKRASYFWIDVGFTAIRRRALNYWLCQIHQIRPSYIVCSLPREENLDFFIQIQARNEATLDVEFNNLTVNNFYKEQKLFLTFD